MEVLTPFFLPSSHVLGSCSPLSFFSQFSMSTSPSINFFTWYDFIIIIIKQEYILKMSTQLSPKWLLKRVNSLPMSISQAIEHLKIAKFTISKLKILKQWTNWLVALPFYQHNRGTRQRRQGLDGQQGFHLPFLLSISLWQKPDIVIIPSLVKTLRPPDVEYSP